MARKAISDATQASVLQKSRRRCCLCFGLNSEDEVKKGQLAHLDGDNKNSAEDNLAFLCLEHHDEYDSIPRLSKGLREQEVRRWRDEPYKRNTSQLAGDATSALFKRFSCHAHTLIEALTNVGERSPFVGIHEELTGLAQAAAALDIPVPVEIETIHSPPGKPNPIMNTVLEGRYCVRYPGGSEVWGGSGRVSGVELLIDIRESAILSLKQWLIYLQHGIAGQR
jgi:hypothetical protein